MNIVLFEPEIPHNTGAVGRTCFVTGSTLHLIKPFGFFIDEKHLRRTGLDYWHTLDIVYHESGPDFLEFFQKNNEGAGLWMVETNGEICYTQADFKTGDYIMFGSETTGIPEYILKESPERILRIPMKPGTRSLNLSVSAGIVLYEALRQNGFSF